MTTTTDVFDRNGYLIATIVEIDYTVEDDAEIPQRRAA